VETRLSLIYQGVRDGRYSSERWVELCAASPARLFGLAGRKGQLRQGFDADVVVFDPEAHRRLDAGRLHMATDHSPYAGMEVTGWPAFTFARGRLVAKAGDPADAEGGWGRFVPRSTLQP
jgi:dihydropyrimidinase